MQFYVIQLYLYSSHNTPLFFFTQAVVISSAIIVISCLAVLIPNAVTKIDQLFFLSVFVLF